jgi:hypothetical protein
MKCSTEEEEEYDDNVSLARRQLDQLDRLIQKITEEFGVCPSDLIRTYDSNERPMIIFLESQIDMVRKLVFPDAWLIRMESLRRLMKCSITLFNQIIESYNVERITEVNLSIDIDVLMDRPRRYETCSYFCLLSFVHGCKALDILG